MTSSTAAPHQALFDTLGPLPVTGRSWPKPIALLAWIIIAIIGARLGFIATSYGDQVATPLIASVVLAYTGMIVVAFYVDRSPPSPNTASNRIVLKRELSWDELNSPNLCRFFLKRLICFPKRGRPIVFKAPAKTCKSPLRIYPSYENAIKQPVKAGALWPPDKAVYLWTSFDCRF